MSWVIFTCILIVLDQCEEAGQISLPAFLCNWNVKATTQHYSDKKEKYH